MRSWQVLLLKKPSIQVQGLSLTTALDDSLLDLYIEMKGTFPKPVINIGPYLFYSRQTDTWAKFRSPGNRPDVNYLI